MEAIATLRPLLQLTLGWLLPSYLVLLLELSSRHGFLRTKRRQRRQQLPAQGWGAEQAEAAAPDPG